MLRHDFGAARHHHFRRRVQARGCKRGGHDCKSNEDRISFLSGFGWTVDSEPYEVMEVVIPSEFDEVYKKYNELQEEQGYDLHDYCGKRLKRWTYQITNYPGRTDDTIFANIYVYV